MKLIDLKNKIDALIEFSTECANREVVIPVKKAGAFGASPSVGVTGIYQGIDWNVKYMFIGTEIELKEDRQ